MISAKKRSSISILQILSGLSNLPIYQGEPVWLDGGQTFDEKNHLPPELLFKGTDVPDYPKTELRADHREHVD